MTASPQDGPTWWAEGRQPERTALAWSRTSLSCLAVALLALKAWLDGAGWVAVFAIAVALTASFGVGIFGRRRRDAVAQALVDGRPHGLAPRQAAFVAGSALALALGVIGVAIVELARTRGW